jgi:choline-sulfatase
MSFMTGRYIHHIETWDNTSPLASDAVTWAHMMRAGGYDVTLSGKQHFIGPDKLHGFGAQLARDIHGENYHAIFPWSQGTSTAPKPWPGVEQAGPGTTLEIEVDDEVEEASLAYIRDPARRERPWVLNASFIAPHFPLVVPQKYWDLYPLNEIDLPDIPAGHLENLHPVYRRMRSMFGMVDFPEEQTRRARAGYYGLITYLDDKIGRLVGALEETGQLENTMVVYVSDHGEMAGEHGMWRKSNFYEQSSRIPLVISWPGRLPRGKRVTEVVSLVDLVATMIEATGAPCITSLDGDSLLSLARGDADGWKDEAFSEYLAHGVARPMAMLRRGRYKLNYSLDDPPELYDLEADPGEFRDLGGDPDHARILDRIKTDLLSRWDPLDLERRVRRSQEERVLIRAAESGETPQAVQQNWYAAGGTICR